MRSLLQSTFISFGEPDRAFAKRLHESLHSNGVRTFFFPEHATPGKKLHRLMRDGVNSFDRVILVCSKASLHAKRFSMKSKKLSSEKPEMEGGRT